MKLNYPYIQETRAYFKFIYFVFMSHLILFVESTNNIRHPFSFLSILRCATQIYMSYINIFRSVNLLIISYFVIVIGECTYYNIYIFCCFASTCHEGTHFYGILIFYISKYMNVCACVGCGFTWFYCLLFTFDLMFVIK